MVWDGRDGCLAGVLAQKLLTAKQAKNIREGLKEKQCTGSFA